MEENKNIELGQIQNNEQIIKEESASTQQEVVEVIDSDFADVNKEEMKKIYIIIAILYLAVIILSVLLILGIKNQKDIIKNNIDDNKEIFEKNEEDKNKEDIIADEQPKEENKTNSNKEESLDDELNILDQI